MKEFLKNTLLAGLLFGLIMGVIYSLAAGLYQGIFVGIMSGLLFGITMGSFTARMKEKFQKKPPSVLEGKTIVMDGAANHFKGKEAVGGWAYLTKEEFIFKSHDFNIQNHQLLIPLDQIANVKGVFTLGVVPNGLQITTLDGKKERFVVFTRKTWMKRILETKNELLESKDIV